MEQNHEGFGRTVHGEAREQERVLYFAYGSCMSDVDFLRTVPEFDRVGSAVLPDYRVAFTVHADSRNGGVADIVPAAGETVEGVLYEFPACHLPLLDEREGVAEGMYRRFEVEVVANGRPVRVQTYEVVNKAPEELAPSQSYRDIILHGSDLATPAYVEKLTHHMDTLRSAQSKTD
jgi:cation transport regulator ChaC